MPLHRAGATLCVWRGRSRLDYLARYDACRRPRTCPARRRTAGLEPGGTPLRRHIRRGRRSAFSLAPQRTRGRPRCVGELMQFGCFSVPPVLSIVLCTYNRSPSLVNALDGLIGQVHGTPAYEVIVVDNNSVDATRDVVGRYLASGIVRYEFEPCQGLSVARNHGVSASLADLIAFTDDDVRVGSTWVQSIVEAFNS